MTELLGNERDPQKVKEAAVKALKLSTYWYRHYQGWQIPQIVKELGISSAKVHRYYNDHTLKAEMPLVQMLNHRCNNQMFKK